jgi:hypothetical protein
MNPLKQRNMMAAYTGFKGYQTVAAIMDQIPSKLYDLLTGRELGIVMNAINEAYHNGRASLAGVDVLDGDCIWLPWSPNGDGQLVPLATLRRIDVSAMAKEGE